MTAAESALPDAAKDGSPAISVADLTHRYGDRVALDRVSLDVGIGEAVAILGPNGGGKTTLFRIVATLLTPTAGRVSVFGDDALAQPARARRRLGVVFQAAALDVHLTVRENLRHHGHLYGLRGGALAGRIERALEHVHLLDRADDRVAILSGGLQRRAELARTLVHDPALLLLDEPTTGLDPSARRDVWAHLDGLRAGRGSTIVVTTHLMDEAARCDRVAILHEGALVAVGAPASLTAAIGGDVVLVTAADPAALLPRVRDRFGVPVTREDDRLRIELARAHEFVTDLVEAFPGEIDAVTFGKPTLEDVFFHHTGRRLDAAGAP